MMKRKFKFHSRMRTVVRIVMLKRSFLLYIACCNGHDCCFGISAIAIIYRLECLLITRFAMKLFGCGYRKGNVIVGLIEWSITDSFYL